MTGIILYGGVGALLLASAIADINKTKKALKIALKSFLNLLPSILPMLLILGIIVSVLSPEVINKILGSGSGFFGILLAAIIGSVAFMPSFITFPFGASLLEHGAGLAQIAAFVSSLMAVGIVSLNVEMQYFGKKSAIIRNGLGLLASILFAVIVWRFM